MSAHRTRGYATLVGAAAAVALVAGGTAYAVSQGPGGSGAVDAGLSAPRSTTGGSPPLPPLETDAGNRAAAVAAAEQVAAALPAYRGAQETDRAGVPQLGDHTLTSVHPAGHTITRSRFWTAYGVASKAVALWYAAHPVAGFHTEGGPSSVGGQGDGSSWIDEAYWDGAADPTSRTATSVEIETTTTSAGVGIRLTVSSVWSPARPLASYVQDVTSIDVTSTHRVNGRHERTTHRSFTVREPGQVRRVVVAFDALPGMSPLFLPCPMAMDVYVDRILFHTATGDVTAVNDSSACGFGMSVHRGGRRVAPQLGNADRLLAVLGLHH